MEHGCVDLEDYGLKIFKSYWYTSIVINFFQKFGWIVPMKTKSTPTTKDFSENVHETSKRSPFLVETDDGKESVNQTFTRCSEKNIFKFFNCYTSKGAVFAEGFIWRLGDHLEELVFQKSSGNCEDEIKLLRQRHGREKQFSTKSTPVQPSLEKNGGYVCPKCWRKKGKKPKVQIKRSRWKCKKRFIPKVMQQTGLTNCTHL